MGLFSIDLNEYPKKINQALLCLCMAWLLHFAFYFLFMYDRVAGMTQVDYLQLGVGVGICVLVARIKRWARMMCIFFNIAMIGMYAFITYAYHLAETKQAALLTAMAVIMFSWSTYLLLGREVAQFFKERDPLPDRPKLEDMVAERLPQKPAAKKTAKSEKKRNSKN